MPIPLWLPLAALVGAVASDATEERRTVHGDPLERTPFDLAHEAKFVRPFVKRVAAQVAMRAQIGRSWTYNDTARMLYQLGLGDPSTHEFATVAGYIHGLAMADEHQAIWVLDDEAHQALHETNPPWELVRDKLPRLPFRAMLVKLPITLPVVTDQIAVPVQVGWLLVMEEIPERKWRYLGFNNARSADKVAYTQGWFSIDSASAKAQLIEGEGVPGDLDYRLTGEDEVWSLLLNLMLALEHQHLEGQSIQPRVPRRQPKKAKKRKSANPYTIVRLSSPSRAAKAQQQADADARSATTATGRKPQKRHLRRGHWKTVWRSEPEEDRPIYATRPRLNRQGEPIGGLLYKQAVLVWPYWAGTKTDGPEPPGRYRVRR